MSDNVVTTEQFIINDMEMGIAPYDIKLFDDTTAREQHKISGNGPSVVTSDAIGNIIVGISDNSIGATQLNVSGNGTTTQYLRSDGDGSFT